MSANLKSQIAGLQRKLAKLDVKPNNGNTGAKTGGSNGRSKRRRMRRKQLGLGNTNIGVVAPAVQLSNPRASRQSAAWNGDGGFRIRRSEYLKDVTAVLGYVVLQMASIPWLSGIAKNFDRLRWFGLRVEYKAAVGTTSNGMVSYGIDWDLTQQDRMDRSFILNCTPCCDHPSWQSSAMSLPQSKLMTRKEYFTAQAKDVTHLNDCAPCSIIFVSTTPNNVASVVGELWIHYDLEFFGTRKE